jgi:hypothetical protein
MPNKTKTKIRIVMTTNKNQSKGGKSGKTAAQGKGGSGSRSQRSGNGGVRGDRTEDSANRDEADK